MNYVNQNGHFFGLEVQNLVWRGKRTTKPCCASGGLRYNDVGPKGLFVPGFLHAAQKTRGAALKHPGTGVRNTAFAGSIALVGEACTEKDKNAAERCCST